MSCTCPQPRTDRDRRVSALLYATYADDKDAIKGVWSVLFVLGHVDGVHVLAEYELR